MQWIFWFFLFKQSLNCLSIIIYRYSVQIFHHISKIFRYVLNLPLNPFQYKHKPYQTINLRKDFLFNFFLTFVQFGTELACIGMKLLPMSGRRADVGILLKRFKKIFQKKVLKMFGNSKKSANFVAVIS